MEYERINPQDTGRAYAFDMWMQAPMSMVTLFKTLDVSRLVKISRRKGLKFNMLMCYCIGKAACAMDGVHAACFLDGVQREIDRM